MPNPAKCTCGYTAPKVKQRSEGHQPLKLGIPRTIIAIMLVSALIAISLAVVMGYTKEMDDTETYLVVTVLTGMFSMSGGMVIAIYGIKGNAHAPSGGS